MIQHCICDWEASGFWQNPICQEPGSLLRAGSQDWKLEIDWKWFDKELSSTFHASLSKQEPTSKARFGSQKKKTFICRQEYYWVIPVISKSAFHMKAMRERPIFWTTVEVQIDIDMENLLTGMDGSRDCLPLEGESLIRKLTRQVEWAPIIVHGLSHQKHEVSRGQCSPSCILEQKGWDT